jgi:two-component system nitrate/nitrite response regulator NarL
LHFIRPQGTEDAGVQPSLTLREFEILTELTTGDSNREIAGRLSISENTLKVHIHNILRKLDLGSRQEAARYARRHGLMKDAPMGGEK